MKYVLAIAGWDPSGGAGLAADIKTFENMGVYGLGICSGVTIQHEDHFEGVKWMREELDAQLDLIIEKYPVKYLKLGLIENLNVLNKILDKIKTHNDQIFILWDPVVNASAGYAFHKNWDKKLLKKVLEKTDLVTPNKDELKFFDPDKTEKETIANVTEFCSLFLKGGHDRDKNASVDILYYNDMVYEYSGKRSSFLKHGTGCVLSSAIIANLAKGYELTEACKNAKEYVTGYINSSSGLLGWHKRIVEPKMVPFNL